MAMNPRALALLACGAISNAGAQVPGLIRGEFIPTTGAPSVHASTIAEPRAGLIAAWFGGTHEGNRDVVIWSSRFVNGTWTAPVEIANGVQSDGTRFPCYNPVLFVHSDTLLQLFYKVGPEPQLWWGMVKSSRDGGVTWSAPTRLPPGILGPIKNKPVRLDARTIISPSSTESHESNSKWRIHFERSDDDGLTWHVIKPQSQEKEIDAIQPSILVWSANLLQAIGRTRNERLFETWSRDGGRTWGPVTLMSLRNPNAGTDAVTLANGRHIVVHNDTPRGRTPLNVSHFSTPGSGWTTHTLESEPGEYSYPAVIQTRDGLVHITYTWRRERIKHVIIDPRGFASR